MGARSLHQNVCRKIMNRTILPSLAAVALLVPFRLDAQDAAASPAQDSASPPSSDYVSRAEYDKLKAEHETMKKELDSLKDMVRQMANGTVPAAPREAAPAAEAPSAGKQVVSTTSSQAAAPSGEAETASTELSGPLATHDFSIVG